jgi:hypothetical protein
MDAFAPKKRNEDYREQEYDKKSGIPRFPE